MKKPKRLGAKYTKIINDFIIDNNFSGSLTNEQIRKIKRIDEFSTFNGSNIVYIDVDGRKTRVIVYANHTRKDGTDCSDIVFGPKSVNNMDKYIKKLNNNKEGGKANCKVIGHFEICYGSEVIKTTGPIIFETNKKGNIPKGADESSYIRKYYDLILKYIKLPNYIVHFYIDGIESSDPQDLDIKDIYELEYSDNLTISLIDTFKRTKFEKICFTHQHRFKKVNEKQMDVFFELTGQNIMIEVKTKASASNVRDSFKRNKEYLHGISEEINTLDTQIIYAIDEKTYYKYKEDIIRGIREESLFNNTAYVILYTKEALITYGLKHYNLYEITEDLRTITSCINIKDLIKEKYEKDDIESIHDMLDNLVNK